LNFFCAKRFFCLAFYSVAASLIRNSLDYASWKDRRALAAAIRPIYAAASAEAAQAELDAFADGPWGQKFPSVSRMWRNAWDRVISRKNLEEQSSKPPT
jgi:transposase-like protein